MRPLILMLAVFAGDAALAEDALPVIRPIEKLTQKQDELLLAAIKEQWAARVVAKAAFKSTKSKERVAAKKALAAMRGGGAVGYGFEGLASKELTVRRVLTVTGTALQSGSYRAKPISLIDSENIIIEFRHDDSSSGETIWLTGVDVSDVLSDDRSVEIDALFVELKPKTYTNTFGATRAVKHWQALPPGYIEQLWETHKEKHAAELSAEFDQLCKDAKTIQSKSPYAVD